KNAERMSQGRVPRKRYKGMDHRGPMASKGPVRMTGRKNRRPADRKHASSTTCQASDDRPKWNKVGICQAITAAVPASQQKTGLLKKCPSNRGVLLRRGRLRRMNHLGSPHSSGRAGAPNRIKGAPTAINRRCFIM